MRSCRIAMFRVMIAHSIHTLKIVSEETHQDLYKLDNLDWLAIR